MLIAARVRSLPPYCVRSVGRGLDRDAADPGRAALSAGGFGAGDLVLLLLFSLTTPWLPVGFWNSVIGLILMRGA